MIPDPSSFNYQLPEELIATSHAIPRDHSRLLICDRKDGEIKHKHFYDLVDLLTPNDVLVVNETKVFPARLFGQKSSGGEVEILLLDQVNLSTWICISKPGLKIGQLINFPQNLSAKVLTRDIASGEAEIEFNVSGNQLINIIDDIGITPLPHYIKNFASESEIRNTYQTVYAQERGSAAAPTAGLHFTPQLITHLKDKKIGFEKLTLHVGLGTFQPLRPQNLQTGKLHREKYYLSPETSTNLKKAKSEGKRIIAVGTTSARALESNPCLNPGWGTTDIFIYPPYKFLLADALITNFHLPQSSLLMMITAFTSAPNSAQPFTDFAHSLAAKIYNEALKERYRFYSFGDAMLLS